MLEEVKMTKTTILSLACYMSLAITLLPIVDYFSPWYVTIIPVLIVICITLRKSDMLTPLAITGSLILVLALMCYWLLYRNSDFFNYILNFIIAFLPCITAIQIRATVDKKNFFKSYLKVATVFMCITSITTIIGLNRYSMASRELASGTEIYDTVKYTRMNIGGYEYIYALAIFIPILCWLIKKSKGWNKALYISALILNMVCIYESQYTIALLCAIAVLFVVWMLSNKKIAIIALVVSLLIVIVGGGNVISDLFEWMSKIVGKEYVADRLMQLSQLFSGESIHTDTGAERIEHYRNAISTFMRSPIWGNTIVNYNADDISGHTFIFDMLAGAGIIGLLILIVIVKILYQKAVNPLGEKIPDCIISVWIAVVIISILNPIIFPAILTIGFMCCMCIQKIES